MILLLSGFHTIRRKEGTIYPYQHATWQKSRGKGFIVRPRCPPLAFIYLYTTQDPTTPQALFTLGDDYSYGWGGVATNLTEGARLYRLAADQGLRRLL